MKKPRGMAVAKQHARSVAAQRGGVTACPYRAKSWRSAWLAAYYQAAQRDLWPVDNGPT